MYRLTNGKNTVIVRVDISRGLTKVCALNRNRTKKHVIVFAHKIDDKNIKYATNAYNAILDNTILSAVAIVNRAGGTYNHALLNRVFMALNTVNDMNGYTYDGLPLMMLARRIYKSCKTLLKQDFFNVLNPLILYLSVHKNANAHLCYQLKGFRVLADSRPIYAQPSPSGKLVYDRDETSLYDSFITRLYRDDQRTKTVTVDSVSAELEDFTCVLCDDLLIDCAYYVHRLKHDSKFLAVDISTMKQSRELKKYCTQMYLDLGIDYLQPTARTYKQICEYAYAKYCA